MVGTASNGTPPRLNNYRAAEIMESEGELPSDTEYFLEAEPTDNGPGYILELTSIGFTEPALFRYVTPLEAEELDRQLGGRLLG